MAKSIDYFTDGSMKGNVCSAGYIRNPNDRNSLSRVYSIEENDIHKAEVIAIKQAVFDISENYDSNENYNVYTDSDNAYNLIMNNDRRYTELDEIRDVLTTHNIDLVKIKSHASIQEQIDYCKRQGNKINKNKAIRLNEGNSRIDNDVKCKIRIETVTIPIYRSTPFSIMY